MSLLCIELCALIAAGLFVLALSAFEGTKDLGDGFMDHGIATPMSKARGIVSAHDGDGNDVVLVWLFDNRGGYGILMIHADTGASQTFTVPWDLQRDSPFASLLSSENKYYAHFDSHFCEFDPEKPGFTFVTEAHYRGAMGMTEGDDGIIYSVTYPDSGVARYNPKTGEFQDFGPVWDENWNQYQRAVATDDTGWLYFGIGSTRSQIIAFNPETEETIPMIPEDEREQGTAYVYRDEDGKVYGEFITDSGDWWEFYGGEKTHIGEMEEQNPKEIITSSQNLFHRRLPSGRQVQTCDLIEKSLVVEDPETGETHEVSFEYETEGCHIMGLQTCPDGTISGGTAFPMRHFVYDPAADAWTNRDAYNQFNTVTARGDMFFIGGYGHGVLMEWNPFAQWVQTEEGNDGSNPRILTICHPTINRPHALLAYPDDRTVIMGGTPGYGYTGGGMCIWDRETESRVLLEHTDLIENHAPKSLLALPDGKLLVGSTVRPGTGGEQKADLAEMYILDLQTYEITWRQPLFEGVENYNDLCHGPDGLVYGIAERDTFYVFDPNSRRVIHHKNIGQDDALGETNLQQGCRMFVKTPDDAVYLLLVKGIACINPDTFEVSMVAESPVDIGPGGDYLKGRIYFGSGSHVYSWAVSER
ncbi:MAG: hypothetical protein R6V19_08440 [Armatimonadota bacterium]